MKIIDGYNVSIKQGEVFKKITPLSQTIATHSTYEAVVDIQHTFEYVDEDGIFQIKTFPNDDVRFEAKRKAATLNPEFEEAIREMEKSTKKLCEHDFEIEHEYDGITNYTVKKCKKCGFSVNGEYRPAWLDE